MTPTSKKPFDSGHGSARRLLEQKWVCLSLVVTAHLWSLSSQFVDFDDPQIFLQRSDLQVPFLEFIQRAFDFARPDTWRPVRDLSHWVDFILHGHDPLLSHVHNLIVLAFIVLAFCHLTDRLEFPRKWSYLAITLAFVHPVQVETVAWISGRKDLLATLFMMLSLISFEQVLESRRRWLSTFMTLSCFLLSVLSKGHMVVIPILYFCLWKIKTRGRIKDLTRLSWMPLIIILITTSISVLLANRISGGGISLTNELINSDRYGMTTLDKVQLPIRYLGNIVWPVDLNHVYLTRIESTLQYGLAGASIVLVVAVGYVIVRSWNPNSLPGPLLLCFVTLMLPYMHLKPGVVYMADRYLFSALPFLFLCLTHQISKMVLIRRLPRSIARMLPWTLIGLSCVLCIQPHAAFSNSISLWSRMADVYPQSAWGLNKLGHALYRNGDMKAATGAWLKAASNRPDDPQYLNNAAVSAMSAGHLELAKDIILKAYSRHPDDPFVIKNLNNIKPMQDLNIKLKSNKNKLFPLNKTKPDP